jgi:hypothetical protein
MKYIIMCGGQYEKWETPRQLMEIQGEKLVTRTIRLLKRSGVKDIAISATDKRFEDFSVPVLQHNNGFVSDGRQAKSGAWVDGFFPLSIPACYIMGDVFFSPEAIETIVKTQTDSIQFFASSPPFSARYIKRYAEPFAFKVVDQQRFRAAISYTRANANTGIFTRHPIAWELWQVICGRDTRNIDYNSYVAINDYTCDIDSLADIEKIERMLSVWPT